jgi:hypothetical protein
MNFCRMNFSFTYGKGFKEVIIHSSMKKRFIILFPIILVLVSEGISFEKESILNRWIIHYVTERTSDKDEIQERIAAATDIQGKIIPQASIYCCENLAADLEYIYSIPKSRIPFVNSIESCGKIYACHFAVNGNIIAYAGVTGYWSENMYDYKQFSEYTLEELENTEFYEEWRQERRDEMVTLSFYYEPRNPLPTTPEGMKNVICSQQLDIPFFDRHFLRIWDIYTKERAKTHYKNYTEHLANDDLIWMSVDLYELYGMWAIQDIIRDVDFSNFITFDCVILREIFVLLLLSAAGTELFFGILYHRYPALLSGIPFGALAAYFSPSYWILLFFFAAGFFSVFLYYKMCRSILDKKGIYLLLDTVLILFLAYYIVSAVINFLTVQEMQEVKVLAFVAGGRCLGGVAVHFILLLLISTGGWLVAKIVLKRKESEQEIKIQDHQFS